MIKTYNDGLFVAVSSYGEDYLGAWGSAAEACINAALGDTTVYQWGHRASSPFDCFKHLLSPYFVDLLAHLHFPSLGHVGMYFEGARKTLGLSQFD